MRISRQKYDALLRNHETALEKVRIERDAAHDRQVATATAYTTLCRIVAQHITDGRSGLFTGRELTNLLAANCKAASIDPTVEKEQPRPPVRWYEGPLVPRSTAVELARAKKKNAALEAMLREVQAANEAMCLELAALRAPVEEVAR